jgi:hypothetical protein
LQVLFLVSWVVLRNLWYPLLVGLFACEWWRETAERGTPWNWLLVTPIFQAGLTGGKNA